QPLRGNPDRADPWRHRAPVRGHHRRHPVYVRARVLCRPESAVLDVLARHFPDRHRHGWTRRRIGRPGPRRSHQGDTMSTTPTLRTQGLTKQFGSFTAVSDVTLSIPPGSRQALIGPNGAGKTTLINLLTGVLKPSKGKILLDELDITPFSPNKRVHLGLV